MRRFRVPAARPRAPLRVCCAQRRYTDTGDNTETWPRRKTNTIVNFCRQGENHLIERFGRLSRIAAPGIYFTLPWPIDNVAYRVDLREKALRIDPQSAITKDNVSVHLSGVVYVQFVDAERAAYGHYNPLFAVNMYAQSAMRAAVGDMELDQLFHDRALVNGKITNAISEAARSWGLEVKRYEVTDIAPDRRISEAMDKQAAAERNRRSSVITATGEKEAAVLRSEGDLIARTNEAEAAKRELVLHAEGRAGAIREEARAQADALALLAAAIERPGGKEATTLNLAPQYMSMMQEMGRHSNTIFFGEQPGDISGMIARITATVNALAHPPAPPPPVPPAPPVQPERSSS